MKTQRVNDLLREDEIEKLMYFSLKYTLHHTDSFDVFPILRVAIPAMSDAALSRCESLLSKYMTTADMTEIYTGDLENRRDDVSAFTMALISDEIEKREKRRRRRKWTF